MKNIQIVPFGEIDTSVLNYIARSLRRKFRCKAVLSASIRLPSGAYNASREQYHSLKLMTVLASHKSDVNTILLGIIDEDLYMPKLNFVFGYTDPLLDIAIISLTRLRQEFYGLTQEMDLFLLRAEKKVIHELGHISGLGHCMNAKCVMFFSNSLRATDDKGKQLCSACRKKQRF